MIGELLPTTPWGAVFATDTLSQIEAEVQQHFWPEFGGQKNAVLSRVRCVRAPNKKCTGVAGRAECEINVAGRRPGDHGR